MTCAQGLLHLLWGGGGPKLECYGTARILLALVNILYVPYCETVFSQDERETKTLFAYHISKNQFTGFKFLQNDYIISTKRFCGKKFIFEVGE